MSSEAIKMTSGEYVPIEMHKVRVVQKLNLLPIEQRLKAMEGAGYNTFLLQNRDVFMDMLTDSGTNAMSDRQMASMMIADDANETDYTKCLAIQLPAGNVRDALSLQLLLHGQWSCTWFGLGLRLRLLDAGDAAGGGA